MSLRTRFIKQPIKRHGNDAITYFSVVCVVYEQKMAQILYMYIKSDELNLFFLMIYEAINCFGHLKIFFLFECEAIVENLSIFLNEFNGISNIPKQMRHAENSRDKCTIDNCVFFCRFKSV